MTEERGALRVNPHTGRYTRARECRPPRPPRDLLTWRQARIVTTLRECGPLTEAELHGRLGIAPCLGKQLAALWKRQILLCEGGQWQVNPNW